MTWNRVATDRALRVVYRTPDYLAVEAVCAFLAFMGGGRVHARKDGPCLCHQCSSERGETTLYGIAWAQP